MTRLTFVMPAHGRVELTRICLHQLKRTTRALYEAGLDARALIVGDDENLETADLLGFGTVERANDFLAAKFNDGLQVACDPGLNPEPADYAIPIGSDDWIDHRILHRLPQYETMLAFRYVAFVNETGSELTETRLAYDGGVGVRVYPKELLAVSGYRPAEEDRKRACDTSILYNTRHEYKLKTGRDMRIVYGDRHPRQIVDWKTTGEQMNTYDQIQALHRSRQAGDPFELLTDTYPAAALEEMRAHYQQVAV